ncbi:hypothetical protein H0H93_014341 [Arthromyces matolae]|nr:hypothetical protein H0H93_014341 [Arthromyces matolae]
MSNCDADSNVATGHSGPARAYPAHEMTAPSTSAHPGNPQTQPGPGYVPPNTLTLPPIDPQTRTYRSSSNFPSDGKPQAMDPDTRATGPSDVSMLCRQRQRYMLLTGHSGPARAYPADEMTAPSTSAHPGNPQTQPGPGYVPPNTLTLPPIDPQTRTHPSSSHFRSDGKAQAMEPDDRGTGPSHVFFPSRDPGRRH